MNDQELNQLLRSVPPPERPETHWRELPGRVTRRLSRPQPAAAGGERPSVRLWLAGLGLATACIVLGFLLGRSPAPAPSVAAHTPAAPDYRKVFAEVAALFPNRLRGVVLQGDAVELILADQADVPASPPLLVELCARGECRVILTFSGQQIEVDGQPVEVLVGQDNQVILLAGHEVWTSREPDRALAGRRVHAGQLPLNL